MPNVFDKENHVLHYENLQRYLRLELNHLVLEFNQSQSLKPYAKFDTQKRIEVEKNGGKD